VHLHIAIEYDLRKSLSKQGFSGRAVLKMTGKRRPVLSWIVSEE